MSVDDLLFEVSNEDRLSIYRILQDTSCNVSTLSQKLDIRIQQISRHLQRLSKVDLIEKTSSGEYTLTNLGWLFMRIIKYLNFVQSHKEYIQKHDIQRVPVEYLLTMDMLENSGMLYNAIEFLKFISENINKAETNVCLSIDNITYMSIENLIKAPSKRS